MKYLDKNAPKLPAAFEKELKKELTKIKEDIETSEKNNRTSSNFSSNSNFNYCSIYDLQIKNAFLHFFVQILFDYTNYLIQVDDEVVFNINLLLENRPKRDHEFYKEFSETQIFQQFTQILLKKIILILINKLEKNMKELNQFQVILMQKMYFILNLVL